ncbi:thioredoxin [Streptoalloteichus tenebrarius]|uniref:Thioredoxin n=1 Tax=Streptoalloteichus tenebrarius (strain ATCC 17920 / DSM 40477 / JCM 4838 / CBS 697.72 / NBRC 16177 / NCIMB 11028 / NRRL B-12390 / A12253. 1 / ISP 5477) TaxID=1933 RepID=A0ABT1HM56_STRSD|nr:thioredoxin [Streptoalloteichus tenebrarius]MCP2256598.1 thioredoxin [Streptoalloteichus tenebrarius]BFF04951.1 thioredoxin [Streptoalloteichus tenebrarius]
MPTSPVSAVTEQTFERQVLQARRPVLIQFWAPWCAPCRMMTPIVEQLASEHAESLTVVKINVDEEHGLAARHGISGIPAFLVYRDGQVVDAWVGAAPKPMLEQRLADHLP